MTREWTHWDEFKHWWKNEFVPHRVLNRPRNPYNNFRVKGHRILDGLPYKCGRCGILIHLRNEVLVTWDNGYATFPDRIIGTCDEEMVRQVYDT